MKKEKKSYHTTIRMTLSVKEYIMRCEGKSFSDKFDSLVNMCLRPDLYTKEIEHRIRLDELSQEVLEMETVLEEVKEIHVLLTKILERAQKTKEGIQK